MRAPEPIAVIGLGIRFPGGNDSLPAFVDFLRRGGSGIGELPAGRGPAGATRPRGGFLERIDEFDAPFFNISPKQAPYIDPQQRLLLETAWTALEDANIDPTVLRHGNSGVYIGATPIDHTLNLEALPDEQVDSALATGVGGYPLSGRLSYFLGLRGPSLTTDTACASSLTALHLAVGGLRDRETDLALCGAVNAIYHPRVFEVLARGEMLASDGRCKAFDEAADGYARAEGCGVLVLKRLTDAERDGDKVLAVVRSTVIGQDGESAGLTAPNGTAQQAAMRRALDRGGLGPDDISYVEAHGTGTPLGDPIELSSINAVFGATRDHDAPLVVGSVKTNLGHMEPAAGIGGVVKVIAQLRAGRIFPHLVETLSGRIPWDVYPIAVPRESTPWRARVRRAMVNSFGVAGAIGVAIVEQPPPPPRGRRVRPATRPAGPAVLTVSAKSAGALARQVEALLAYARERDDVDGESVCLTRNTGRAHFRHRIAGVVASPDGVVAELERMRRSLANGGPAGAQVRRSAFLFTGSGAQYVGMGRELYDRFAVFRERVDACDALFAAHLGRSVKDVMFGAAPDAADALRETTYTHAALFTVEYALAGLWLSWGIRPAAVLGHSVGEIIAATVAGALDLTDGIALLVGRANLIQSVPTPGGMAAVRAPAAEVDPLLRRWPDVSIAAINAPNQCVLSGAATVLDEVLPVLGEAGFSTTRLDVTSAFHSPLMDSVADDLRAVVEDVTFHEPSITIISNLTGEAVRPGELADPTYWTRHLREPVDFEAGMRTLLARGRQVVVEIGPSPVLTSLARQCADDDSKHVWLHSLHPKRDDATVMLGALAGAYTAGLNPDWDAVHAGGGGHRVDLPTYAFERARYWLPQAHQRSARAEDQTHPLLGRPVAESPDTELQYVAELTAGSTAYLADHTLDGRVFLPAGAYVEMMLAIGDRIRGHTRDVIRDVRFHEALFLTDEPVQVLTRVTTGPDGRLTVSVASRAGTGADAVERRHMTASVEPEAVARPATAGQGFDLAADADRELTGEQVRAAYLRSGLDYGPQFLRARSVRGHGDTTAVVEIDGAGLDHAAHLPPPVFDAAMHGLAALADDGNRYVATAIDSVRVHRKPRSARLRSVLRIDRGDDGGGTTGTAFRLDVVLADGEDVVAEMVGVRFTRIAARPRPVRVAAAAGRPDGRTRRGLPHRDDVLVLGERERVGAVCDGIRATVAHLLHIEDAESVDSRAPFLELGMDSLVALELKTAIEHALPVTLSPTAIFDHACAEDLAAHLVSRLPAFAAGGLAEAA